MKTRYLALLAAPVLAVLAATSSLASTGASIASHDVAGYSLTGRTFRYVQTITRVPTDAQCAALAAQSPDGAGAAITLGPAEESNAGVSNPPDAATVGFSFVPSAAGCGLVSISFADNQAPGQQLWTGNVPLSPGDQVKLALFYNAASLLTEATVTNLTNTASATSTFAGAAHYTHASATAGFGPYTNSGVTSRLYLFTGSTATTITGKRGHFGGGPWTTDKVIMINGGVTNVSPGGLWNSGQNFAVRTH